MITALLSLVRNSTEAAIKQGRPDRPYINQVLLGRIHENDQEQPVDLIIYLEAEANLEVLDSSIDKIERRKSVVQSLQAVAERSQAPVIMQLEQLQNVGVVTSFESLWIVNAIRVNGKLSILAALATQPEIDRVEIDEPRLLVEENDPLVGIPPPDLTWGLERIRARHVWDGLGVDGSGVTLAIVDTGVEWEHPALVESYRGTPDGPVQGHSVNWYDTVDGARAPFDPHGHGTHVAGTAVGKGGIGVAPGAQWIAVRVLDQYGFGTTGDIHAGFQWLLAPSGDPSLSPDIVNNSWGNVLNVLDYLPDVLALKAAGIIPIFAAGNDGPTEGSIHVPAGYPDTFAVGASDDIDRVAWFSSRGPSSFTGEVKPTITAPGAYVLSSLPSNSFGYGNGTSMATPHTAGVVALLLSANPALTEIDITTIITGTAAPVGEPIPSHIGGWGRIDAYTSVSGEVSGGFLSGEVFAGGIPLPQATVHITTTTGSVIGFETGESGRYAVELQPGLYGIAVDEFGYSHFKASLIAVTTTQSTIFDIHLDELLKGAVSGRVFQSTNGEPVSATIRVSGAPLEVTTDQSGQYSLYLPLGDYELIAESNGFLLSRAIVEVRYGTPSQHDFALHQAPSVLLVDSGQWYYRSQADYYKSALESIDIAYDMVSIRNPYQGTPYSDTLSSYDVIIWSAPSDSPAQVAAGEVISSYLSQGGNLLISGQNVGSSEESVLGSRTWWRKLLEAEQYGKISPPITVTGSESSIFASTVISLNGIDSAGNQEATDRVRIRPRSFTEVALQYGDGSAAGLQAGECKPFNIVYIGFGLEGVTGSDARADVISRSMDYFSQPDRVIGLKISPDSLDDIVVPSDRVTKTVEVFNLSQSMTDTFQITLVNDDWPVTILTNTLTLGSCQSGNFSFAVDIPAGLSPDTSEEFYLLVTSLSDRAYYLELPVRFKTPGHVLLVDDDRWHDREEVYMSALEANGINYDYWEIGSWPIVRGSPPAKLLSAYDFVIWYTGYDWFAPITNEERGNLELFLEQGGRLFLSSQDYLHYHRDESLTTDYLGLLSYEESVTPTIVFGTGEPPILDILTGPITLDFGPYMNFADGLVPGSDSTPSLWHDGGMAAGLATAGDKWRTAFWAFPFETLPTEYRGQAMGQIVGWLSDLGDTTFELDARTSPESGDSTVFRTYSLTLRMIEGPSSTRVFVTNTLPTQLVIDPTSITGGAHYDPAKRELTWQDQLDPGDEHLIRYRASVRAGTPAGSLIKNTAEIYYDRHNLRFQRSVPLWVSTPDLSTSSLVAELPESRSSDLITYHLEIINSVALSASAEAVIYFPEALHPISSSISSTVGTVTWADNVIKWQGPVVGRDSVRVTLVTLATKSLSYRLLPIVATLSDRETELLVLYSFVELIPYHAYLPAVVRR